MVFHPLLLPQKNIRWPGFNGKVPENIRDSKINPHSNRDSLSAGANPGGVIKFLNVIIYA
jgi:hypothetical protein